MKKVTLDLMLGRKSKSHFRKFGQKSSMVAAQMPVNTATKASPYGLRFGKNGLNAGEICDNFNNKSKNVWEEALELPAEFIVNSTKTYTMEIKAPTVYTLHNAIYDIGNKTKKTVELPKSKETVLYMVYKMALLKTESTKKEDIERSITEICGSQKSYDLYNPWRKEKKSFNYKKKNKK